MAIRFLLGLLRLACHALILAALILTGLLSAQTTVSTGSIVGEVSDPMGAVINGAVVRITNVAPAGSNAAKSGPSTMMGRVAD